MATQEKRISGLSRTFEQYKQDLIRFTNQYYPDLITSLNDASVGNWFLDLNASIGDNLSNYIDRAFNESQIDTAQQRRSLFSLARSMGLRIPGRKASLVEVEISCDCPMDSNGRPDVNYLPVIRKGTQASGAGQIFELLYDCDFSNQFSKYGISNRQILPLRDSNSTIIGYTIKKAEVMSGSETKIYTAVINDGMIVPFMEIILPENNVLSVESIIFKEGTNFAYIPSNSDFSLQTEFLDASSTSDGKPTWRYFEVENLLQDKLFLPDTEIPTGTNNYPQEMIVNDILGPNGTEYNVSVVPGSWKVVKQKYITEYTDKGYMKIIFGAGSDYGYFTNDDDLTAGQKQIRRIVNNMEMGVLPQPGSTIFIQYRIGGGSQSNIASNVINQLTYRNIDISGDGTGSSNDAFLKNQVDTSIKITNISPSVSGKDEPSNEDIRNMVKYNNLAQNRCVTIQDYKDRIERMPPLYGAPFRTGIVELNNIIYISILGIDRNGKLTDEISTTLIDNMTNYLSEYKLMTDYVIIKPAQIINLEVEVDIVIDKAFNNNDVVREVIDVISDFFDIHQRKLGEYIYTSRLIQKILSVAGVNNLIELRVFNIFNDEYSKDRINQAIITGSFTNGGIWEPAPNTVGTNRVQVDLVASDGILYSNTNSMFEIRNKNINIRTRIKNV